MWHLIRLISFRHATGAPLRTLLTVLGVAVGVATVVGVMAINRSVLNAFRSTVDTIAGKADLTVAAGQTGFPDSVIDQVKAVPGVAHASAALTAIAPVDGVEGVSLMVLGVDLLDDGYFRTYEGADRDLGGLGDDLEFLNSTDRLLVSERFARERSLSVGDHFALLTPSGVKDFTVHALIRESGPVKAFGGAVAVMDLASAQEAFSRDRHVDRIDIGVSPDIDAEAVKAALQKALGPTYEVERPSRRGGTVEKMVRSFQMGLNLGSGVALLVGVFLVYNTVAIGVVQRRREIGALRALGATRLRIRALLTAEAVVLGAVGTAVGLPLGLFIARAAIHEVSRTISAIYVRVNATDVQVTLLELSLGLLLGLLGSAIAALRPAIHASAVPPVEALRKDAATGAGAQSLQTLPTVLGAVLLALAWPALVVLGTPIENFPLGGYIAIFCVLMGATLSSPWILRSFQVPFQRLGSAVFGISGRLAADNFTRAPGRSAVPVSALSLGVAMTIAIGGFVGSFQRSTEEWIEQSVPADLFITSSSKLAGVQNTPVRPDIAPELEKLQGVQHVDLVRIVPHDVLGLRVYLVVYTPEIHDARAHQNILAGKLPTREERARGAVSISENLAWRRQLKPGSTFPLNTPTGEHTFTVAAVVTDYTSDQGTVFLSREVYLEMFRDDTVDTFELYLSDPSRLDALRQEITARFAKQYNLFVLTNQDLRNEARKLVEAAFGVTYAMEVVAVLLALLGVINTLLSAVLDRTREIGLLRAVGAGRAHVLKMFTAEAAFIGLAGGLLGIVTGWVVGIVVTQVVGTQSTGWSFPYRFPAMLALQMTVAASLCAVLAGLLPARRAARLDVVEALAYE
jgi:putative ABC transport system permease protein